MEPLELSPSDVRSRLGADDLVLLDCREAEELGSARIAGAMHVPMGDVPQRLPHLDPEKQYVVFCHKGQRSLSVAQFLRRQDYGRVWSMRGGIDAWSAEVDPSVPRY